ncbi:hypothetical protein TNCT_365901 [Trichonephila clavata]|uniref:Uncharacterized protein n=1 Tax=Trichonephila clavata TaxID=2740835 RepID=A0A8X6HX10_TRICU|nr:hypothetical protein TNCT_365901 [Trichonephila clavata]
MGGTIVPGWWWCPVFKYRGRCVIIYVQHRCAFQDSTPVFSTLVCAWCSFIPMSFKIYKWSEKVPPHLSLLGFSASAVVRLSGNVGLWWSLGFGVSRSPLVALYFRVCLRSVVVVTWVLDVVSGFRSFTLCV